MYYAVDWSKLTSSCDSHSHVPKSMLGQDVAADLGSYEMYYPTGKAMLLVLESL